MRSENNTARKIVFMFIFASLMYLVVVGNAFATDLFLPTFHVGVEKSEDPGDVSVLLQIIFLLTILKFVLIDFRHC